MARIERICAGGNGWIRIEDDKRSYPVSLCPEGANDLTRYLRNVFSRKEFYVKVLPTLRQSETRYLLKLAIDNADRVEILIQEITEATSLNKGSD